MKRTEPLRLTVTIFPATSRADALWCIEWAAECAQARLYENAADDQLTASGVIYDSNHRGQLLGEWKLE